MRASWLLLVASSAAAFAPAPMARSALILRGDMQPLALSQVPRRSAPAVIASASTHAPPPLLSRTLPRLLLAALTTLFSVFLRVGRAVAAERTVRTAPVVTEVVSLALSGNFLKCAGLAAIFGTAYAFRKEEPPMFTETVMTENEQPAAAVPTGDAEGDGPESTEGAEVNNAFLLSSLQGRMMQLAEERRAAEEAVEAADDEDAPTSSPSDSTDSWGSGSTAVLEPPRPHQSDESSDGNADADSELLDGPPAVDFPLGFPLVDGEVSETGSAPAASADQIAMLNRMMGLGGDA